MKSLAVVYLPLFREQAMRIAAHLQAEPHEYRRGIFAELFSRYAGIVCVMSTGIVVRSIAPLLKNKWEDPAVVAVSPDLRYGIPILGGHHGANDLAISLETLGIVPVITTATEAMGRGSVERIAKDLKLEVMNRDSTRALNAAMLVEKVQVFTVKGPAIVIGDPKVSFLARQGTYTLGLGCRRGVAAQEVVHAIDAALAEAGIARREVLAYATIERKSSEGGLIKGVESVNGVLIFLDEGAISAEKSVSPSAARRLGLSGVAEPCALAISRRKELVLPKRKYGRVTVAIAR